MDLIKILEV